MNRETFKIIVRAFFPNAVFKEWGRDYYFDWDTEAGYHQCCCASITPLEVGCGLPDDTIVCHSFSTFGGIGRQHIYDRFSGELEDTEANLIKFLKCKADNTEVYLDD